ncbi:MAG TPA: stage II sporulation protein M [Pirellulales bacterium]|jgi:uncharacterized membrane protein SpoIIM required for sporulation|nr:stage II sporulation protein M [Pirellulales bacterium]
MKVVELLEQRRTSWRALELLCVKMEGRGRKRLGGPGIAQFASLYRSACADLALADSYQLPANTVLYLHQLVARAHNQLYRSRRFNVGKWWQEVFQTVPQRLFRDKFLRISFIIFWGLFLASMLFARQSREYAEALVGKSNLHQYQEMYSKPLDQRNGQLSALMQAFYSSHNSTIGLECFAFGLVFGVGGLVALVFNAAQIGAVFGYMSTVSEWSIFSDFVTAHGPFELSAVVLCGAAGMRLGFSMIDTKGLSRAEALRQAGREAMPSAGVAVALFFLAAPIEGFVSPSAIPYAFKVLVAIVSAAAILFYVVVLGSRPLPVSEAGPTHAA